MKYKLNVIISYSNEVFCGVVPSRDEYMRIRIFIDTVYYGITLLQEIKQRTIALQGQKNGISALRQIQVVPNSKTPILTNEQPYVTIQQCEQYAQQPHAMPKPPIINER